MIRTAPVLQAVEPGEPFSIPIAIVIVAVLLAIAYLGAQIRSGITLLAFAVGVVVVGLFLTSLIPFSVMILGLIAASTAVAVLGIMSWRVW